MARKQTSARVSTKAARLLAKLPKRGRVVVIYSVGKGFVRQETVCSVATLLSICGSALVQDETPGQLSPKQRRAVRAGVKSARRGAVSLGSFKKYAGKAGARGDVRIGSARSDSLTARNPNGRKKRKGARR